jgi:hypothetical protein
MLMHLKFHSPFKSLYFWWASPVNAVSLIIIPVLYSRSSTIRWGFMFNAAAVLIGTIGMSYYSLLNLERPLTVYRIIIESTLPNILILWSKIPIAYLILLEMQPQKESLHKRGCVEWQEKP